MDDWADVYEWLPDVGDLVLCRTANGNEFEAEYLGWDTLSDKPKFEQFGSIMQWRYIK
jgi:hypothetical protein